MSRSFALIAAAVLTLLVLGGFAYWALGGLVHPRVAVPLSAVRSPIAAIEAPADWQKIDTKQGFSFYAPPGTHFQPLQGEDSFVGEISSPTFMLQYDFGFYSNDLSDAKNNPDYSEESVSIYGRNGLVRRATLQSEAGPHYFVGLYVREAVFHSDYPGRWAALEIHGTATSAQDRATVERMFKTIQFEAVKNAK